MTSKYSSVHLATDQRVAMEKAEVGRASDLHTWHSSDGRVGKNQGPVQRGTRRVTWLHVFYYWRESFCSGGKE